MPDCWVLVFRCIFPYIFFSKFDAVVYWEEVMETKNDLIVNLIEFGYKLS